MLLEQADDLEEGREAALLQVAIKIQARIRALVARKKMQKLLNILHMLAKVTAERDEQGLKEWLQQSVELPYHGRHTKEVKAARALMDLLEEEARVAQLMRDAMEKRDLHAVQAACDAAAKLDIGDGHKYGALLAEARALIERIKEEQAICAELDALIKSQKSVEREEFKEKLFTLLAKCKDEYDLDSPETRNAEALKLRLEEEDAALEQLGHAIDDRNLNELTAWLSRMTEMGLDSLEVVKTGKALKETLLAQGAAVKGLIAAINARALDSVVAAIEKAKATGVADDEAKLVEAIALQQQLEKERDALQVVEAAVAKREREGLEAAIAGAKEIGLSPNNNDTISSAAKLLVRLKAEEAASDALGKAIESNDANALEKAIGDANELGLSSSLVADASAALAQLGAQNEASAALGAAMAAGDLDALKAAIVTAEGKGVSTAAAARVVARLENELACSKELEAALEASDLAALQAAITKAGELGLAAEGHKFGDLMAKATALGKTLQEKAAAVDALEAAIKNRDADAVDAAIAKAAAAGITDSDVLQAAEKLKGDLVEEQALTAALAEAVQKKDKDVLEDLLAQAAARDPPLSNDTVNQAKIIANREKMVAETRAALKAAIESSDIKALSTALDQCIQLGLDDEEVQSAQTFKEKLQKEEAAASEVRQAMSALEIKAVSAAGVTEADTEALTAALKAATDGGLRADSVAMTEGQALLEKIKKQITVQSELLATLEKTARFDDHTNMKEGTMAEIKEAYNAVKTVLEAAEDLGMQVSSVDECKRRKRELDALRRARQLAKAKEALDADDDEEEAEEEDEDDDEEDDEEEKRQREEKYKKCGHPKYLWHKYSNIRDPNDWASGSWFSKSSLIASQFKWVGKTVAKSMMHLPSGLSKEATRLHKCILGYCGDKTIQVNSYVKGSPHVEAHGKSRDSFIALRDSTVSRDARTEHP